MNGDPRLILQALLGGSQPQPMPMPVPQQHPILQALQAPMQHFSGSNDPNPKFTYEIEPGELGPNPTVHEIVRAHFTSKRSDPIHRFNAHYASQGIMPTYGAGFGKPENRRGSTLRFRL